MNIATLMTIVLAATASAIPLPGVQNDGDDKLHVVLPRDAIPAISDPEFEPVSRADRSMADEELVIGLVGEHEQRAYSAWQLDRHEIVNDIFDGRPVAVTWCPLCGTGIVYSRQIAGQLLTLECGPEEARRLSFALRIVQPGSQPIGHTRAAAARRQASWQGTNHRPPIDRWRNSVCREGCAR